jgi:hypothetical protein
MTAQLWNEFENQIIKIIKEIDIIKTKQESTNEYMKGYTRCYSLLSNKNYPIYAEKMYNFYYNVIQNYANEIKTNLQNIHDSNFIMELDKCYQKYILISKKIKDIMSRLERYYISLHSKKSLDIVSKNIFKNYVFDPILEVKDIYKILNNTPVDLYLKMNKIIIDMNIKSEDIISEKFIIEI